MPATDGKLAVHGYAVASVSGDDSISRLKPRAPWASQIREQSVDSLLTSSPGRLVCLLNTLNIWFAMTRLGQRLRELRTDRGLTVRQLAELIDRSPGYISQIEVRNVIPSAALLCTLADVLETDAEDLLARAKQSQLAETERQIDANHADVLAIFRKERK